MSRRTQWIVLCVVLGALGFLLWRNLDHGDGWTSGRKQAGAGAPAFLADEVPVVHISRMSAVPGETFERDRDLFHYAKSPEEIAAEEEARRIREEEARRKAAEAAEEARRAAEQRRLEEEERRRREAEALRNQRALEQQQKTVQPAEPPPPDPPEFKLAYIGIVGPKHDAFAILQDSEDKLAYARAGEVLDGSFRVERVGQLNMDLTYTNPIFSGLVHQVPRTFEGSGDPATVPSKQPVPRGRRRR